MTSSSSRVEWRLEFTVDRTVPGWDQEWFRGETIIHTSGEQPVQRFVFFDSEIGAILASETAEERGGRDIVLSRSTVTSTAWEQVDLPDDEAEGDDG